MTPKLAIVIPAYKPDFFFETLQSIRDQTDKRFSLYIFDDASPANLEEIVNRFNFEVQVFFQRFDENLGSRSLVKQWERCIRETEGEEWVWLFSDDDIMAPDCVKSFYLTLESKPGYAAYRFDTHKISNDGEVIKKNQFPDTFDGADFLNLKLSYQQESYIVEYIFSLKAYNEIGGFPDLPLAWTTDDIFCLKLANYGEICSIDGGVVNWRYSESNISGRNSRENARLKMEASSAFVNWVFDQPEVYKKLKPQDLCISWYVRQIRSMEGQLTLWDELKSVQKIARRDKRIWKHYFEMKKNRSKIAGWLKIFSS